jgi:predicted DNA-binding ribbon-helix-helix protein
MNEQQGPAQNTAGKLQSFSLEEHNLFFTSLNHICADFSSDVQQIQSLLKDNSVKLPIDYNETREKNVDNFSSVLRQFADKSDDVLIEMTGTSGEPTRISKRDLRTVISIGKRVGLKNSRNRNFLQIVAFNHLVTLFDAAMQDIAEVIFRYYPLSMLPNENGAVLPNMSYADILNAADMVQLKEKIVAKELESFARGSIRKQITLFNKILNSKYYQDNKGKFSINISVQGVGSIIEIRETRNIHVHNKGIVNKQYFSKINEYFDEINKGVKDAAKRVQFDGSIVGILAEGDFREITEDYVMKSIFNLEEIIAEIYDSFVMKFVSKEEQQRILRRDGF